MSRPLDIKGYLKHNITQSNIPLVRLRSLNNHVHKLHAKLNSVIDGKFSPGYAARLERKREELREEIEDSMSKIREEFNSVVSQVKKLLDMRFSNVVLDTECNTDNLQLIVESRDSVVRFIINLDTYYSSVGDMIEIS